MRTLLRFGWRELWASKGRTTLIALILAVQTAVLGGGFIAFDSLFFTRDTYYDQLHLADLDVQFVATPENELPALDRLRKIPGVRAVSRRFVALGYIEKKDGSPLPVIVHHLDPAAHPAVNDILIQTGQFLTPDDMEAAVVDRSFAKAYDLKLGDKLVVNPSRFAAKYTIVGVGLSPEFLVPTANPGVLVPSKGSIGIIYGSRANLDRVFYDKLYNDLLFTYEPGADEKATTKAVLAALHTLDIESVVPKKSNFGFVYVKEMLVVGRIFTPTTAGILALMAAIVTFISINRLIMNRRREIGGLLAQGYAPSQFILGILVLGFVPGVVGAVLGAPGAMGVGIAIARMNADIPGLPEPIMHYTLDNFAFAMGSAVLVGLVSAFVPALSIFKLRPAHALGGAGEIRFAGLPGPLARIGAVMSRSFMGGVAARYALRNVFRRVRLSFAAAVLIALAIALPAGMLTAMASWDAWARSEAANLHWDAAVGFKVAVSEDQVLKMVSTPGIGDYEVYTQGMGTLARGGGDAQEVRVRGLSVPSTLLAIDLKEGSYFSSMDADEVILNTAFSHGARKPSIGEMVSLTYKGKVHQLKVVGLVSELTISTVMVPINTTQRIFEKEGKFSGVYMTFGTPTKPRAASVESLPPEMPRPDFAERIVDEETDAAPAPVAVARATDPQSMRSALLDSELVTSVQLKTEVADAMLRFFEGFRAVIASFVWLGGLLAFLFILSILGFLLLERETEYATLRTMGYGVGEIAKTVLIEVAALAVAGFVIALAAWAAIAAVLGALTTYALVYTPINFRAFDIGIATGPTVIFLVLAALPGIRGLMRLNLATVLRGRAMG